MTSQVIKKLAIYPLLLLIISTLFSMKNPYVASSYGFYNYSSSSSPKRYFKGIWITTASNLDWPSAETRDIKNNIERIRKSKAELIAILDKAVEMNFNAVFFQVSPEADAFYKSDIVPWSRYLTGTFGKDPGFDPLQFAIEEAHKRNLEFHAWFNPYRVSMSTVKSITDSLNINKSVYREHPDWIKISMSRYVVDPGIPEARKWVINRVMEVVNNYDIDGVHFDDYFYYERFIGEMDDTDTYNKYNKGRFSNIGDFRRDSTYLLIKELSEAIRNFNPQIKFGVSPGGIWANKIDGHPNGSNTTSSYTNYDREFADTRKWVLEELIDYIAPQLYFSFSNPKASYTELALWWANLCKNKNVDLYIGHALYRLDDSYMLDNKSGKSINELKRQLFFNLINPEIKGSIFFRAKNLFDENKRKSLENFKNSIWSQKTLIPEMPWKKSNTPISPIKSRTFVLLGGRLALTWQDKDINTAYYAIYKLNADEKIDLNSIKQSKNLLGTVRKRNSDIQLFVDYEKNPENFIYLITSLDRMHSESSPLIINKNYSKYFFDVDSKFSWAIDSIDYLYENNIIKGVGNSLFLPVQNTKRGDFILMIVRALKLNINFEENFADVPITSYYYNAIGIAKALGIVHGNGFGYEPETNITRQDMMVIINRVLKKIGIPLENPNEEAAILKYEDKNEISSYAVEAVTNLTSLGLVQGDGNMLRPKKYATRAEIAVILKKVLFYIQTKS